MLGDRIDDLMVKTGVKWLHKNGCNVMASHLGIIGASTTAMAASFIPEITLTAALSPSDFIMEGFYRDGLDGAKERPGNNESTLSYKGESLPYLPFSILIFPHRKYGTPSVRPCVYILFPSP